MSDVTNVSEMFGKNVFNDSVMRERLPKSVYKKLKKTIEDGTELDPSIADVVAHAMKDWAIERGATHFHTGFQPLTGITAEKHDSFNFRAGKRRPRDHGIFWKRADKGRARTLHPSRQEDCAPLSRPGDIQPGTALLRHFCGKIPGA